MTTAVQIPTQATRLAAVLNAGVLDYCPGLKRAFLGTYRAAKNGVLPLVYTQSKYGRFKVTVKGSKGYVQKNDDSWENVKFPDAYCLPPQQWPSGIRAFVYGDLYDSCDIAMSHNTFYIQLCERAGIECPIHRDFKARQDEYIACVTAFDEDLTRSDVKGPLFHRILYGGDWKGFRAAVAEDGIEVPVVPPEMVANYAAEIEKTLPRLYDALEDKADILMEIGSKPNPPKFIKKFEYATKDMKRKIMFSVVSRKCMQLETNAIKAVMKWCYDENIKCGIYVNDELHIEKGKTDVHAINRAVKSFMGFDVTFKITPMTRKEEWIDYEGDLTEAGEQIPVKEKKQDAVVTDDVAAARIMIQQMSCDIRKGSDRRVFVKDANIWVSDEKAVDDILRRRVLCSGIMRDCGGQAKPYAAMVAHARNIVVAIKDLVPVDDDFLKLLQTSSIGKLCFKNGVYDFSTKEFKSYDEAGVYSTVHTGRDYFRDDSEEFLEMREEVNKKICLGTLGDQWDDFRNRAARALAGHYTDKIWMGIDGLRNSSKGTLLKWFLDSFGDYVTVIIAERFVYHGNDSNPEEELKNKWLKPCENARLAFSSEVKMDPESKMKLDGVAIKKFTSGGDVVMVRGIQKEAHPMIVNATLCMMYNALPPIYPADALENLECYTCPYKYVQKHEMPATENKMFKEADDSVKTSLPLKKYALDAFISIILDGYQSTKPVSSTAVRENTAEFREEGGDFSMNWTKWFEFTADDKDFVSVVAVKQFLASRKIKMGPKLIQSVLEGYGAKKDRERSQNGPWGFKCLKLREETFS